MSGRKLPEALKYTERFEFSLQPGVAERFREHCRRKNITPGRMLKSIIEDAFPENKGDDDDRR